MSENKLVKITTVNSLAEAEQIIQYLKENGVSAMRQGGIMDVYTSNSIAGEDIMIDENQLRIAENLEAVENFKGSRDEKLVVLYCKQLGINYKNLSDEEFRWLIRILKKSKKMGTPISQRKKR